MSADPHPTIALLQNHSLTMVVQQEIERAILSGEFAPGAKLNEAALALRLGVSRGPVREAFRMLDEAGLVRTEKNRGVFVRDIPIGEAIEIYELRAAMEESVGRRLAERMDPAQREEAHGLVRAMESAVQAQDAQTYHRLNLQFHDHLTERSAVLDWEMATIGEPLMDLGTTLGYWMSREAGKEMMSMPFNPRALVESISRREIVGMYARFSGRDVSDILFYYVFGTVKIAVIAQQIFARYSKGLTKDVRFANFDLFVKALGQITMHSIGRGSI